MLATQANRKTEDTPEVETDTANVLSEITGTSLKYAQDFLDKAGGDARTAAKVHGSQVLNESEAQH